MPHLILTPGDPTGIGPEITVKALRRLGEFPKDLKITVVGSVKALELAAKANGVPLPTGITLVPIEDDKPGAVAYQSIDMAVQMIADKKGDALVTGPISKHNLAEAQHDYQGHTEILEELGQRYFRAREAKAEMLFVHKKLRLLLLTRHIPISAVPSALALSAKIRLSFDTLIEFLHDKMKIAKPRLAVLGVNPHAGEIGGTEEHDTLQPIMAALHKTARCEGPFPADGFFRTFDVKNNPYDAIVAAYHDQGLIPFKMLAGYEAVNMTIGLPFIRTSVSHGTADSLIAALHAALEVR
jgi:4-phospho-D-threonate 3-dehydrogenase / 4-phospho-D-erythronate 3-dehydrogenase